MNKFLVGSALGAIAASFAIGAAANAQSTGTVDFENAIVVTGVRTQNEVAGVVVPDTAKAKAVLTDDIIQRQQPGQTILNTVNLLPGVSFQNNDPYGSAGGTLSIRGFSSDRISLTFDGIPLNDTGNYAVYSNQQLDPELIEQVNVNLGSTDVDSPTAAASGSTVNYRTRNPKDEMGAMVSGSLGGFNYRRLFAVVDTGTLTASGTKAWISGAIAKNDNVFNDYGKIDKKQVNAKVYQPLGDNGDFVSVSGNYNENRNNFFGSVQLRNDLPVAPSGGFPQTKAERFYSIAPCTTTVAPVNGTAQSANSCGSLFDERMNPSNTGNIRLNSRFTLADNLILTVDPSYQYVKANGGGTVVAREGLRDVDPTSGVSNQVGYLGGAPYFGRDLNGDGDLLDSVRMVAPSQTQTHRFGVISSLRYEMDDNNTVRLAYSFDYGRHRQTGEVGLLQVDGRPVDPFPVNDPQTDVTGSVLQKRDRLSKAMLNQLSGEYRGQFLDDALVTTVGLRLPFFKRDLTNNCFTTSVTGNVDCFGTNATGEAAYATTNPTVQGPQRRVYNYNDVLPNIGVTYKIASRTQLFANYSKGIQVPGTDPLYNAFFFAAGTDAAKPDPETTDNFDLGFRYTSSKIVAQASGWYTRYQNRLASAYDPELDRSVYRNLGRVDKYGVDGSVAYSPIKELSLYAFGSYLKSEIKEDVQLTSTTYAATAGKRESGAPVYTFGARATGELGPITLGVQAKRTGKRYINDLNAVVAAWGSATVPAYTLVDLDARFDLEWFGLNDKSYLQFNVSNLTDTLYVGGFGGNLSSTSIPFVQIGSPRSASVTLVVGF